MKSNYYRDNPAVIAAQQAIAQAIEEGQLTRPESCELCGEVPGPILVGNAKGPDFYRTSIFAHHWNGYDHPLDVWFICRACDGKLRGPECHNGSMSKEEARYLVSMDMSPYGRRSKTSRRKLIVSEVEEIIELLDMGVTQGTIAERFGVTRATINHINTGRTWSHLPRPEQER